MSIGTVASGAVMSVARGRERGPLAVKQIRRETMQEDVYRQAKELILNGELAPGQCITIQWLADAFGVLSARKAPCPKNLTGKRPAQSLL